MKLDVAVDRFIARGVTGEPVTTARVYTQEALPALAPRFAHAAGIRPGAGCDPVRAMIPRHSSKGSTPNR
jgi:hypothetical protein